MIVLTVLCSYFLLDVLVYGAIVSEQNVLGGGGGHEILLEVIEGTKNYRVHGKLPLLLVVSSINVAIGIFRQKRKR